MHFVQNGSVVFSDLKTVGTKEKIDSYPLLIKVYLAGQSQQQCGTVF